MLILKANPLDSKPFSFPEKPINKTLKESFEKHFFRHELAQNVGTGNQDATIISEERTIEKQAQDIFDKAYADGRQAGFDEAKNEGKIKGFEVGKEEVMSRLLPLTATFEQSANDLSSLNEDYKTLMRESTLQLVEVIAQRVIENELSTDSSIIIGWIDKALSNLPDKPTEITINLSSNDFSLIEPHFDLDLRNCSLKESTELLPGQVDVRTDIVDIFMDSKRKINDLLEVYKVS